MAKVNEQGSKVGEIGDFRSRLSGRSAAGGGLRTSNFLFGVQALACLQFPRADKLKLGLQTKRKRRPLAPAHSLRRLCVAARGRLLTPLGEGVRRSFPRARAYGWESYSFVSPLPPGDGGVR